MFTCVHHKEHVVYPQHTFVYLIVLWLFGQGIRTGSLIMTNVQMHWGVFVRWYKSMAFQMPEPPSLMLSTNPTHNSFAPGDEIPYKLRNIASMASLCSCHWLIRCNDTSVISPKRHQGSSPRGRTRDASVWSVGQGTGCCQRACGARTARETSGCPSGRHCRGSNCTWMVSGLERETEQENIITISSKPVGLNQGPWGFPCHYNQFAWRLSLFLIGSLYIQYILPH